MWKTILIVLGLRQLVQASVLQIFRENHINFPNEAYVKLNDGHALIPNLIDRNLRAFKSTPYLHFGGSVTTEGKQSGTKCREQSPHETFCDEFELKGVNCTNSNYQKQPEPEWRCEYRFYQRGPRNLIISDFKIKCADPLHRKNPSHYYEKGTCDYEFRLKLNEITLKDISDRHMGPNDDHLQDPEGHILLIVGVVLAGSSILILVLVVICACVHAAREGREDTPVDDLDICPNCSNINCVGCDCGECVPDCTNCNCDPDCDACLDGCASGCCEGITLNCFEACFKGLCEGCCVCTGHVAEGIASSSFR